MALLARNTRTIGILKALPSVLLDVASRLFRMLGFLLPIQLIIMISVGELGKLQLVLPDNLPLTDQDLLLILAVFIPTLLGLSLISAYFSNRWAAENRQELNKQRSQNGLKTVPLKIYDSTMTFFSGAVLHLTLIVGLAFITPLVALCAIVMHGLYSITLDYCLNIRKMHKQLTSELLTSVTFCLLIAIFVVDLLLSKPQVFFAIAAFFMIRLHTNMGKKFHNTIQGASNQRIT